MTRPARPLVALVAATLGCLLVAPAAASTVGALDAADVVGGRSEARDLLQRSVRAGRTTPHVGEVTVVTFGVDGPSVASLSVRVGPLGDIELRRPTRWLVGAPRGPLLVRGGDGARMLTPAGARAALDVDAVLDSRAAAVGGPVELDTGTADPIVLTRLVGASVADTLFVDRDTGMLVRRETRAADGRVLRVVAYTALTPVQAVGPGSVTAAPQVAHALGPGDVAVDGPWTVPAELPGGFRLVSADEGDGMMVSRWSDGLSVLSVYQQQGVLDVGAMDEATVVHVAGRDVWTWPGSEPLRMVWTGAGRTWTAVTDAPLEVVEDALGSLPGEMVGHDVGSRLRRGLARVTGWLGGLLDR